VELIVGIGEERAVNDTDPAEVVVGIGEKGAVNRDGLVVGWDNGFPATVPYVK
jgi:hypothetical protein